MTDKLRQAAEMALKALEVATTPIPADRQEVLAAKEELRQALAEPDTGTDRGAWSDVPDATKWVDELRGDEWTSDDMAYRPGGVSLEKPPVKTYCGGKPNYCEPEESPKREWQGLTDEDILEAANIDGADTWVFETAYAIEAKLKEKNT